MSSSYAKKGMVAVTVWVTKRAKKKIEQRYEKVKKYFYRKNDYLGVSLDEGTKRIKENYGVK